MVALLDFGRGWERGGEQIGVAARGSPVAPLLFEIKKMFWPCLGTGGKAIFFRD